MGNLQISNLVSTQQHKEKKGITYIPVKNSKPENVFNKKDTIKFDNATLIVDKENSYVPIETIFSNDTIRLKDTLILNDTIYIQETKHGQKCVKPDYLK